MEKTKVEQFCERNGVKMLLVFTENESHGKCHACESTDSLVWLTRGTDGNDSNPMYFMLCKKCAQGFDAADDDDVAVIIADLVLDR